MKTFLKCILVKFFYFIETLITFFCIFFNFCITKFFQTIRIYKLIFLEGFDFDPSKNLLLLYLPTQSKGWILEKINLDIISSSEKKEKQIIFVHTILDIFIYQSFCKIKIHSLHQSYVKRLILFGFKPSIISTTYTHTRLDKNEINKLKKINYILPVNNSEANLLYVSGICKNKIIVFPQGYDPCKFNNNKQKKNSIPRNIDLLYVGKYVNEFENSHYCRRKNYAQAIEILNEIAKRGKKVFILGNDWDSYNGFLHPEIKIENPNHKFYPDFYKRSKILISTSIYEGGPVSWLEGMASGCYLISYPTGFAKDANFPNIRNYLLPINSNNEFIVNLIIQKITNFTPLTKNQFDKRSEILFNSRLEELNKILVSINNSSPKKRMNWIKNNIKNNLS